MNEGVENPKNPESRPPSLAQAVEGYLALLLIGLIVVSDARRVGIPEPVNIIAGVGVWGLAWLFAISGVQRGRGGARVAAWVSLIVLVWHAAAALMIAYH